MAQDDDLSLSGIQIRGPSSNTTDGQHRTLGVETWTSRRAPLGFGESTGLRSGRIGDRYERRGGAERELQSRRIYPSRETLAADSQWTSATHTVFGGTYRRILGAAKSQR